MRSKNRLKVCFLGGKQAGIIGVLTLLSRDDRILSAVSYSKDLTNILKIFGIPVYKTIETKDFIKSLCMADLLISVHGKEIIKPNLLRLPRYGGINIHPYLYKYKGQNPVGRALQDKEFNASVGVHIIEDKVDEGKVLFEEFIDVSGSKSIDEIYNKLYPYYCRVLLKALDLFRANDEKRKK